MAAAEFAGWGLAGGMLIELLDLAASTRRHKTFPWFAADEMRFWPYIYCALTRPAVGAVVALALGLTGQVSGAWGLLIVGAGAPLIIQNASRQVAALPEVVAVREAAAVAGPGPEPTADREANEAAVERERRRGAAP